MWCWRNSSGSCNIGGFVWNFSGGGRRRRKSNTIQTSKPMIATAAMAPMTGPAIQAWLDGDPELLAGLVDDVGAEDVDDVVDEVEDTAVPV